MWKERLRNRVFLFFLLFLAVPSAAAQTIAGGKIVDEVRWSGEVVLDRPLQVEPGATLVLEPGTRVRIQSPGLSFHVKGRLVAQGTQEMPVRFEAPPDWEGILFLESGDLSSLEYMEFKGVKSALRFIAASAQIRHLTFRDCQIAVQLLKQSDSRIEGNRFVDNEIALKNEMKSHPLIRGNRFVGNRNAGIVAGNNSRGLIEENLFENNRNGIVLTGPYEDSIQKNKFISNGAAIYCSKSQATPEIANNLFEKNDVGVYNNFFAFPSLVDNRFVNNVTAVSNDRFGSARILHNLFSGNEKALSNNRKSQAVVEKNVFTKNALVFYSNYSSYPVVNENIFSDNKVVGYLDIHMSADFEAREGSKSIVREESKAFKTQNPMLEQAPEQFEDFLDLSQNWWGEDTARLESAGPDANLDLFFDRHDMPEVEYEGYEGKRYALDRVVYAPWLEAPVPDAGPRAPSAAP